MTQRLSDRDYEVLSAYLDGELSHRDQVKLEFRLRHQPELQAGLDELRQTSLLLRKLPQKRAPRNFTIQQSMVRTRSVPLAFRPLRLASVLASLLFVIVFASDLISGTSIPSLASKMAAAPTSVPAMSIPQQDQAPAATAAAGMPAAAPLAPPAPTTTAEEPAALMAVPAPTESPTEPASAAAAAIAAPTETAPATENGTRPGCMDACTPTPEPTSAPLTAMGAAPTLPLAPPFQPQSNQPQTPVVTGTYGLGGGPGPDQTQPAVTATPEPTQVPPTEASLPAAALPVPTDTGLPESAQLAPTETPPMLKAPAYPGASPSEVAQSSSRSSVTGSQSPAAGLPQITLQPTEITPVPMAPPAVRPALRAMEFFFAGLAILTGLAALLVRFIPRA